MSPHKRPNILLIQPDQHRGTIMGCAGDTQVHTPNLDRLAAQGIRFSHAASSSPVCCPFRGTLQTGLYQHTHGVDGNNIRLNPHLTGFAELFAQAGYATGYIGKWHLDGGIPADGKGYVDPDRRFGWQEWHGYKKSHEFFNVWQHIPNEPGHKDRGDTRFVGGFGIYDAPEPWGPWTTAFFTREWDVGPGERGEFPPKWMSADGKTMYLVFSGDDNFCVRKATLKL